jgi:arylsulfatase
MMHLTSRRVTIVAWTMNRRGLIKASSITSGWRFVMMRIGTPVFLAFIALAYCASIPAAPLRPNIIVILGDDIGFSDVGCYGSEINTPNLDTLAAGGVRFTQFYNTARCCPTRACLLSGLYPHQAGVGHMTQKHDGLDGYVGDLNDHCVTIAQVLKPAGYGTYMLGKLHITPHTKPDGPKYNWPTHRGFDRYYGTINGAGSYFDPGTLTRDDTMISAMTDPEYQPPAGEPYFYTNALGAQACRFIDEHHAKTPDAPFFMYCAFTAAHWPMHALPRDIEKYKGKYDVGYGPIRQARFEKQKKMGLIDSRWELSPQFGDWDKVKDKDWEARCMEVYAASIDCMDQNIGRIVETLKKDGLLDNTLILFMQDNGGNLETVGRQGNRKRADHPTMPIIAPDVVRTEGHPKQTRDGWEVMEGHGVMPGPADTYIAYGQGWANVSNTPFREYKHFVHEGGIATPLIAHWPAHIKRHGEFEAQPSHLIDILATCVDLAGATYPQQFNGKEITPPEGTSLLPAFDAQALKPRQIFWEHEGNRAVRDGEWKLVATYPAGQWELYNMVTDRTEMHDLAAKEPARLKAMIDQWEAWGKRVHALPWPWEPQYGESPASAGPANVVLDLKPDEEIAGPKSPRLIGKAITITATLDKIAPNGVIVAQGGSVAGYSLYLQDGKLYFAVRSAEQLTLISSPDALPDATHTITAKLAKDANMALAADDKQLATGKAPMLIGVQPKDGLQVGRDKVGAVGEYTAPFAYRGEIKSVKIEFSSE